MPRLHRDRTTWLIYAQLGIWGYFLYGFGPVVPLLRDEQQVKASVASLHGTALAVGAICGGLLFATLIARFGRARTLWLALIGMAVTAAGLLAVRPLPGTLLMTAAIGTCGTVLIGAVVAELSERHGPAGAAAIAEANATACAMGVVAPLVIGLTVGAGLGWRPGMAVLIGLIAVIALMARPAVREKRPPTVPDNEAPARRLPHAYWLAWALMAVTGAVEVCLSLWAGEVLRDRAGMTPGAAAAALSAIVAGMLVGRLIGGRLTLRLPVVALFLGILAISLCGFLVFWSATVAWLAVVGLVLAGLGNAMHYPLGIALALRVAPGQEDQAAARSSYSIAVSFGVAPFALGAVADGIGAHAAFLLVPGFLVVAALVVLRLGRQLETLPATP